MLWPSEQPHPPRLSTWFVHAPYRNSSICIFSKQTATSDQQQSATANNPNSPPAQVQCTLCGWNFDNDNFLQLHMVLMHSKRSQALLQRRLKRVVDEYNCRLILVFSKEMTFSVKCYYDDSQTPVLTRLLANTVFGTAVKELFQRILLGNKPTERIF